MTRDPFDVPFRPSKPIRDNHPWIRSLRGIDRSPPPILCSRIANRRPIQSIRGHNVPYLIEPDMIRPWLIRRRYTESTNRRKGEQQQQNNCTRHRDYSVLRHAIITFPEINIEYILVSLFKRPSSSGISYLSTSTRKKIQRKNYQCFFKPLRYSRFFLSSSTYLVSASRTSLSHCVSTPLFISGLYFTFSPHSRQNLAPGLKSASQLPHFFPV
jgi:hypothetical protein